MKRGRAFWESVVLEAINTFELEAPAAAEYADKMLAEWQKRFDLRAFYPAKPAQPPFVLGSETLPSAPIQREPGTGSSTATKRARSTPRNPKGAA